MPFWYFLRYRLHTCHVLSQILSFLFLCFVCRMREDVGGLFTVECLKCRSVIQDVVSPKPNIKLAWKMDDFVLEFAPLTKVPKFYGAGDSPVTHLSSAAFCCHHRVHEGPLWWGWGFRIAGSAHLAGCNCTVFNCADLLASAASLPPPHRLHTSLCLPSPLSLKYRVFLLPSSYMTKVNCPVTCLTVSDTSDYLLTLRVKVFRRYWWNCNVVLHVVVFMNRKIKVRCRRIAAHTKGTFQWRHREKCLWVLALSAGPWYSPLQLTLTVFLCTYFCV